MEISSGSKSGSKVVGILTCTPYLPLPENFRYYHYQVVVGVHP